MIGLILAGGQGRRLGGLSKAGMALEGRTLLERVITRLRPQCAEILLNLGADAADTGPSMPVIRDAFGTFEGPLAGVLAGLDWAIQNAPASTSIVTVTVDSPFLPLDLCARLKRARHHDGEIVCATSAGNIHPLHAIWPVVLRDDLNLQLSTTTNRKVGAFQARHPVRHVAWGVTPIDPFFNINTDEDVAAARAMIAANPDIH